jgi:hypothetical protein
MPSFAPVNHLIRAMWLSATDPKAYAGWAQGAEILAKISRPDAALHQTTTACSMGSCMATECQDSRGNNCSRFEVGLEGKPLAADRFEIVRGELRSV